VWLQQVVKELDSDSGSKHKGQLSQTGDEAPISITDDTDTSAFVTAPPADVVVGVASIASSSLGTVAVDDCGVVDDEEEEDENDDADDDDDDDDDDDVEDEEDEDVASITASSAGMQLNCCW